MLPFEKFAGSSVPLDDVSTHRRLIGRLLYLTHIRPDITFVVQQPSQCLDYPTEGHLIAPYKVLHYLKGGQGIVFPIDSKLQLQGFCNANWASCPRTKKSISGFCMFLGHYLTSQKYKTQSIVPRSSLEAEYRSMASATCELQWLKYLLQDLCIDHPNLLSYFVITNLLFR